MKNPASAALMLTHFLHAFTLAALEVFLPLYLVYRNISIEEIGLIFAILPLVMLFFRQGFAAIADEIGTGKVFKLNGLFSFLTMLAYSIAASPVGFAIGSVFQGLNSSAFWSVARTEMISQAGKHKSERFALLFFGLRYVADFLGRIAIGFGIIYLSFANSLFALIACSAVVTGAAFYLNNSNGSRITKAAFAKIFEKKSPAFWKCAIGMMTFPVSAALFYSMLFPLYTHTRLGFDAAQIGLLVAAYSLITGITAFFVARAKMKNDALAVLAFLFLAIPMALFGFAGKEYVWLLVLVNAVGAGFGWSIYETMLVANTKRSRNISTDIGLIHVPAKIMEFAAFAVSGYLISMLGYEAMFVANAALVALFAVFVLIFKNSRSIE